VGKISERVLAEEPVCPSYEQPCGARASVVDHTRTAAGATPLVNLVDMPIAELAPAP